MTQYFLHDGNQELGPFGIEQLKSQNLKEETPIWHEGLEHWTTAGKLPEIKNLLIRKIPPPFIKITEQKLPPPKEDKIPPSKPNQYTKQLPEKNKAKLLPMLTVIGIIAAGIIVWLLYQNSKNQEIINTINDKVTTQEIEKENAESERNRINQAITAKNMKYRNNWSDYIEATNGKYQYSEMGGIKELKVIVTNNTEYMLDEVEVLVHYIKKNGDYFKTETVMVYNIPAKGNKSVGAPESNRGTSVRMDIQSITSKKMHFCYSSGNWANNSEDPYFCK